jgi:hypothetical protein
MPDLGHACTGLWTVDDFLFLGYSNATRAIGVDCMTEVSMQTLQLVSDRSFVIGGTTQTLLQVTLQEFISSTGFSFKTQENVVAAALDKETCAISLISRSKP